MGVLSGSMTDRDHSVPAEEAAPSERERLWRSSRVADLSSGIAHEVRNPLNAMAIHLEVLSDKLRNGENGSLPLHLEGNLDAIRKQIRRLDDIIREFAEFAQARSDHRELGGIVRSSVALCAFPLRRLGLELVVSDLPQAALAGNSASISLAVVEMLLLGTEAAEVGTRIRIDAEVRESEVWVGFSYDGASSPRSIDPERLAMVAELVEDQGGWLERGEGTERLGTLILPLERSTGDNPSAA